ncbi:hypothetical protein CCACVL1_25650 [Corchorus capsularis]|uniref:Uncharacterized protein n=1 Tax=Corchorus capsularis TaxID=210143 RepID=A0A1R3GIR1_COCAP|nr:hypothetical protein CCACVL1_25650 [Corchorus capsularis]
MAAAASAWCNIRPSEASRSDGSCAWGQLCWAACHRLNCGCFT